MPAVPSTRLFLRTPKFEDAFGAIKIFTGNSTGCEAKISMSLFGYGFTNENPQMQAVFGKTNQ